MAGNHTNGGANNGSINIGTMNVPLSETGMPPVDVINDRVGRSNIKPLNLFPETTDPQVGDISTPPATMHFPLSLRQWYPRESSNSPLINILRFRINCARYRPK